MKGCRMSVLRSAIAAAAIARAVAVDAHSASDAYLTLDLQPFPATVAAGKIVARGQWDIALRDLNFVLKLDDDGDGNITWRELRVHQAAIAHYAYAFLELSSDGRACTVTPARQMVDTHADGAYAALFFDFECTGRAMQLSVAYRLFFAVDPSHRGILTLRSGSNTATSVLSPDNAHVKFTF
jgi:hypothetical protein